MLDPHPINPTPPNRRWLAGAAAAAIAGVILTPAITSSPATAAPTCSETLPYGASASADLLALSALDLRPLGLGIGPVADVSIATTGAGMSTEAEVASAAAARDVAANILGLDTIGLVSVGELGKTALQEAPPANSDPVTHTGLPIDLGLARADIGTIEAYATWDEKMRCGELTGTSAQASAGLLDAAILPGLGDRALVSMPDNLSSRSETGLVERDGNPAAHAQAAASLADVRLFAGSDMEIRIKAISEPTLEVVATGSADTSTVDYHSPVLEISGPTIETQRLDAPGTHIDIAVPTLTETGALESLTGLVGSLPLLGTPVEELLNGLVGNRSLEALTTGDNEVLPPLELSDLPGIGGGELPLLGDVLDGVLGQAGLESLLPGLNGLSLLRISIGDLQEEVEAEQVSAAAASLRVQVLSFDGAGLTEHTQSQAMVDLGIGLLEAAATAPGPPAYELDPDPESSEDPGGGGGCEDCEDGALPVTGSTLGIIVGTGTLLAIGGRFLLLASRRGGLTVT